MSTFILNGKYYPSYRPLIDLLYQPRVMGDDVCGAVGVIRIGRGTRITSKKSTHKKSHMNATGIERGPPWWDAGH